MAAPPNPVRESPRGLERLILFSDGIFAIAVTLLVIELRLPEEARDTGAAFWALRPKLMAYLLSFLVIYSFWVGHHRAFRSVVGYDTPLIWLNGAFLLCIAFLPFPVAVWGDRTEDRFAVTLYALTMAGISLLLSAIWWYLLHRPRLMADVEPGEARVALIHGVTIPAIFLGSLPLALVSVPVATCSWVLALFVPALAARIGDRRR